MRLTAAQRLDFGHTAADRPDHHQAIGRRLRQAAAALDDLVEVVATYGFGYRMEVEDSVAATRAKMFGLAICSALVALILAIFLDIL